jgi:Fur family transcriptional regulator, peroxide stress response regulator
MNKNKYKKSRQRTRILEILKKTTSHPTANWIYDRLKKEFPRLSMGTVYRNLTILQEQGFVKRIENGSTFDRFDANTAPHYHFICEKCGMIYDVSIELSEEINNKAAQATSFLITHHKIDFYGMCSHCQHNEN